LRELALNYLFTLSSQFPSRHINFTQRLKQIEVQIGTAEAPEVLTSGVEFTKWELDKNAPLRASPPSVLVPVRVTRRRASTGGT
jgi:hypothetical protein